MHICPKIHVLISDSSQVKKNYFVSNIVLNETVRILRHFSMDYFEADVKRSTCLHAMSCHQGAKCLHFDISDVIYDEFSHGAASYMLNGENGNVMLDLL